MEKISIRQLKRDIRLYDLYELYDGSYGKYFNLLLLNEHGNIYINIINNKEMLEGFGRIDSKEFMQMKKTDLFKWINSVIYYCCNEPIDE